MNFRMMQDLVSLPMFDGLAFDIAALLFFMEFRLCGMRNLIS